MGDRHGHVLGRYLTEENKPTQQCNTLSYLKAFAVPVCCYSFFLFCFLLIKKFLSLAEVKKLEYPYYVDKCEHGYCQNRPSQ